MGNKITSVKATRETPQGRVMYPLPWSLVADELFHRLTELGFECIDYADDVVLTVRGKLESTLCVLLQDDVIIIEQWCFLVGLNINPNQTTVIPFIWKRKCPAMISLNGEITEWKSEVKYIGITLVNKLQWNKHVDVTASEVIRTLMTNTTI